MAGSSRTTFTKRQKESARQERQRKKPKKRRNKSRNLLYLLKLPRNSWLRMTKRVSLSVLTFTISAKQ